jgi:outer membrane protein OmpU
MKKILFATTALVATAGVAAANENIALSGSAEMGIVGGDAYAGDTQFWTDIDVTFTMTGEADNGLTFGAKVDLDENGAFAGTTEGGETIYVSYGNVTLTMGDVDGAFDAALQEVNVAGGSIDDAETAHAGFSGNGGLNLAEMVAAAELGEAVPVSSAGLDSHFDGQIAQLKYAMNDFTIFASVELEDGDDTDGTVWGLGVAYTASISNAEIGVGLGYQSEEDAGDVWGISLDTTFDNGISAALNYSSFDPNEDIGDDKLTHIGLGLGYTSGNLAVGLNWGQYKVDGDNVQSGFGLAGSYDLGGGLSAVAGYGKSSYDDDIFGDLDDADQFSLGLSMSF